MRALFLSLAVGVASIAWMAAPQQVRADSSGGLNPADTQLVQWYYDGPTRRDVRRAERWARPGWWGNSYYYYPGYATNYYPYSNFTYYPGYSSYYYTPGYSSYYYTPSYYWTTPGYITTTPRFGPYFGY